MTYKLITEFKKAIGDDPVFSIRAAIAPLFMMMGWQEPGPHPLHTLCLNKGRDTLIALSEKEYVGIATDRFHQHFTGEVSTKELLEEYIAWEKDVQKFYDEVATTNPEALSDEALLEYALRVFELFRYLLRTLYIESIDYDKILGVVGPTHKEKLDTIWERATESAFMSFEARQLGKLIDIALSDSVHEVRKARFLFTDYFWPKDDAHIKGALDNIRQNIAEKQKEYEKAVTTTKERHASHNTWLLTLDPDSKRIAEYAQLVMRLRDERKDPIAQILAIYAELSVTMLKRAGVEARFAPLILIYEYIKGIPYLASIKTAIESRDKGVMYLAHPDHSYEIESCDFEAASVQYRELFEHKTGAVESLKGQIACRGKVQGTVRVIFDPHDDKGFQRGDILITSMTRPEFVPLMKMAGAVVTNEGGITCHAAIVSRELNIPCIIGTKIATQVLHDGDRVEVDANEGMVTVLK